MTHPFLLLMMNLSAVLVGFILCWAVYVHPKRSNSLIPPVPNKLPPPPLPGSIRFIVLLDRQLRQQYNTLSATDRDGLEGHHLQHLILLYTQRQKNRKAS